MCPSQVRILGVMYLDSLADPAESNQGISTDETDYSSLFEPSRFSTSFESDDEDKSRTKTSPTHVAQAGSPVHFGLAQVCIKDHLSLKKFCV